MTETLATLRALPSPEPMPDVGGPGTIRLVHRQENDALLRLFSDVPMKGSLQLTTDRSPDFFALYDIQRAHTECWTYDIDGQPQGLGTMIVRDGWFDGEPRRVGYLGDLRAAASIRGNGALPRMYGTGFEQACERLGCELYYTAILSSNAWALKALVEKSAKRRYQPHYQLLHRFDAVQVQFTRAKDRSRRIAVRTATPADVPEITRLLNDDHRRRAFGYRFDAGEFEHRLARWPGFTLDATYLAHDGNRLLGVTTLWDAGPLKQYRVVAYRGGMRLARAGFDVVARLTGNTPLPAPGGSFRYRYLANLSVVDDRADVLEALLRATYGDTLGRGYHFLMLYMQEGSALNAALNPFSVRRLGFQLHSVTAADMARRAWPTGPTGFEIALA